jgi:hypothetical protein
MTTHNNLPLRLHSAVKAFDKAVDGPSGDAEHQAALNLRDAAKAIVASEADDVPEAITRAAAKWSTERAKIKTKSSGEILTGTTAVLLADIVRAAWNRSRIARALDNGYVISGTARGIGDDRGSHAGPHDDIRECYLHVTMDSGWEQFWPMSETVEALRQKLLVIK